MADDVALEQEERTEAEGQGTWFQRHHKGSLPHPCGNKRKPAGASHGAVPTGAPVTQCHFLRLQLSKAKSRQGSTGREAS